MDNPSRTTEHIDRIAQRRNVLRDTLSGILRPPASFVCEVGCGHGHFLAAYAATYPDRLCLGFDINRERIERAIRKRDRAKLSNLHFIQASAADFLCSLPDAVSLAAIYVLFPDPWPKRRHHKNRLMQQEFLHSLAQRAERGARLFFRTDHEPYFRATESILSRNPEWQAVAEPWPFEQVTVFQSRAAHHFSLTAQLRKG
jgi:tRNA (guanine-N7-)-methyltransferase